MPRRRRRKGVNGIDIFNVYIRILFNISSGESQDNYLMGYVDDANWAEVTVSRTLLQKKVVRRSLSIFYGVPIYLSFESKIWPLGLLDDMNITRHVFVDKREHLATETIISIRNNISSNTSLLELALIASSVRLCLSIQLK